MICFISGPKYSVCGFIQVVRSREEIKQKTIPEIGARKENTVPTRLTLIAAKLSTDHSSVMISDYSCSQHCLNYYRVVWSRLKSFP